jgi:hypothetical protein
MYKSDISYVLARIGLDVEGPIVTLMDAVKDLNDDYNNAIALLAQNSDPALKNAANQMASVLNRVKVVLSGISPFQIAGAFRDYQEFVFRATLDYPRLGPMLAPWGSAISQLAAAYDRGLQKQWPPSMIPSLFDPCKKLRALGETFSGIDLALGQPAAAEENELPTFVELAGTERLQAFAAAVHLFDELAKASIAALENDSVIESGEGEIFIASIESGSPIKIVFGGNGKAIQLFFSLLRDVGRFFYQNFTPHGRVQQSMETLGQAKKLGIKSPEVLKTLNDTVLSAAKQYAHSIESMDVSISANGKPINPKNEPERLLLEAPNESAGNRLPRPSNGDTSES